MGKRWAGLAESLAETINRHVEVVSGGIRMCAGPEKFHQDFFGHGALAVRDQVLEDAFALAARPVFDRLVVLVYSKWAQAIDDK